ncbi:serologically defined colon cancer antigen 3 homolog isoform X3 [Acanthaster planci]|uniref:Endosome-associated-trafficking regulator 1 n=1 Tax=Acanthaster planci TaxID=133434 RepID=A0A8B7ZT73_ACAPL|nr:serologically defined colon cancer antigen 3 homolog isoform X3 [Acanthaster planci]
MTSLYKFRIKKSPKNQSKSVREGSNKRDQGDDKDEDPNNPFSFKEFVKKDKRKAVYYNSKEGDIDGFSPSDSEPQFLDMGNQASQGSQGSSAADGKTSQRRATSSGVPNRSRGKPHRSAQSAINPAPPIPPHGHSVNADFHAHSQSGSSTDPVKAPQIIATDVDKAARGAEFVDFIYDYATKDDDQDMPERTTRSNTGTNMSNGPSKSGDRKHGRERARAHTHGHSPRKHKAAAATNKAGNTKSQLVVDYMDATVHSQDLQSPSSLSASLTSVPTLSVSNGTEVDESSLGPKPGRERARAQSHGHRKKLPKRAPEPPTKRETTQSVPEIVHAVAAENGHEGIYQSPRPQANGMAPDKSSEILAKENGESKTDYEVPLGQSMPDNVEDLMAEVTRLRSNNRQLKQELVDAKRAVEKDAKKIEGMEAEMRRLRDREVEDAKTLETMVHHVEANLKRTTERAVTAENTITKLKTEIKSLKSEIAALTTKNKKLEEGTELEELKEKSHAASIKLATAAKEADASIKQMANGVEALKLLAETLACIDRISEVPKSFGTAL